MLMLTPVQYDVSRVYHVGPSTVTLRVSYIYITMLMLTPVQYNVSRIDHVGHLPHSPVKVLMVFLQGSESKEQGLGKTCGGFIKYL